MTKKKNNNNNKRVSSGYTPKRIPQGMIYVGTSSDGTKIYSASALIMKRYYPDLYKMRPNRSNYIFTGNNGVYTPIPNSNNDYNDYIDKNLLRANTLRPALSLSTANYKNTNNTLKTNTNSTTIPASAYDERSPIVAPNVARLIYWDPVNKHSRWVLNRRELENRMFQNNLLEGTLLFGGPPLIAFGLSNPATALPTIGGLAGYMGGSYVLNKTWLDYVSPEHNTFDYDFGNAVVLPVRELIGDKNKASITDKNATIVGSLVNPVGWLGARAGANLGTKGTNLAANTYNSIRDLKLNLPDSQYLLYIDYPLDGPYVSRPTSGFMIKSLFEGNGLEASMNKYGDISVLAIKSYMKTVSKADRLIMLRALDTFGNQSKISYNEFKTAVLQQIPQFTRVPSKRYATYGLSKIDRNPNGVDLETYTFVDNNRLYPYRYYEYKNWPINRHYEGDPLAHTRTFTPEDSPSTRVVMESQSDWALNVLLDKPRSRILVDKNTGLTNVKRNSDGTYTIDEQLGSLKDLDYMPDRVLHISGSRRIVFPNDLGYLSESEITPEIAKMFETPANDPVLLHMANTYEQRLIYENMRLAAENGQTEMLYPTSQTAARILKYTPDTLPQEFYDKLEVLLNNLNADLDALYEANKDNLPEWYVPRHRRFRTVEEADPVAVLRKADSEKWDDEHATSDFIMKDDEISDQFFDNLSLLLKLYPLTYSSEEQTILNRYKRFPKLFEELFPGRKVEEVVDDRNKSWYQIKIPDNFMDMEWQFNKGGRLIKRNKLY